MLRLITKKEIIDLHYLIIEKTGGEHGILYEGTIDFIAEFLSTEANEEEDILRLAAMICNKIITGHPFIDGNKRTGFEATDVFLVRNGYLIDCTADVGVEFTLSAARYELAEEDIYKWLKEHTKRII